MRNTFSLLGVMLAGVLAASSAHAEVMVNVIPNGSPVAGLDSFIVQLEAAPGTTISTVSGFELTGAHQMWLAPASATGDTPFTGEASAAPFGDPSWNAWDTHLLVTTGFNQSPSLLPVETNDGTNPASVNLVGPFAGFNAVAGIGGLRFTDSSNPANNLAAGIAFLAPQPSVLDLLQVVVPTGSTALLNMILEDSNTLATTIANLEIGGGTTGGGEIDLLANIADGSTISLQGAFRDGTGLLAGHIMLSNGNPTSTDALVINNLTVDPNGLFSAQINETDPLKIDLLLDIDAARQMPRGSLVGANLLVETTGGNLNYSLTASVPEPSTVALAGLAMVGLVGLFRRK